MTESLAQLRYVAAVAQAGSFSAAARACRVSQPTVSAAVAELERRVGGPLFRRSAKGVLLTPLGESVLPQVESVLGAMSDLDRSIEALRSPARKLLRIAFSPVLDPRILSAVGDRFRAEHPDVEIVYKECVSDDLRMRMAKSTVDVVFAPRVVGDDGWGCARLYSDRIRYLPRGGLAVGEWRATVTLAEVARERLVLTAPICGLAQTTRGWFDEARLPLDAYLGQAMSYTALMEYADLGLGGALVPESKAGERAHELPLLVKDGSPVLIAYDAMWSRETTFARHVREFVRHLSRPASRPFARSGGVWEAPGRRVGALPRPARRTGPAA
jgi:DNA-binding transcriptional LysR family regulator